MSCHYCAYHVLCNSFLGFLIFLVLLLYAYCPLEYRQVLHFNKSLSIFVESAEKFIRFALIGFCIDRFALHGFFLFHCRLMWIQILVFS